MQTRRSPKSLSIYISHCSSCHDNKTNKQIDGSEIHKDWFKISLYADNVSFAENLNNVLV